MSDVGRTFCKLNTSADVQLPAHPISTRKGLSGTEHIFHDVEREVLAPLGEVSTPNLAELFVAVVDDQNGASR